MIMGSGPSDSVCLSRQIGQFEITVKVFHIFQKSTITCDSLNVHFSLWQKFTQPSSLTEQRVHERMPSIQYSFLAFNNF